MVEYYFVQLFPIRNIFYLCSYLLQCLSECLICFFVIKENFLLLILIFLLRLLIIKSIFFFFIFFVVIIVLPIDLLSSL